MSNTKQIERLIQSAAALSEWGGNEKTLKAYLDGARFLLDLVKHNPHLIKDEAAEEFRNIIYPSIINNT